MMEVWGIVLLRPYWLLALPAIAAVAYLFAPQVPGLASWNRAMDPHLMAAMHSLGRVVPGNGRRDWLPVLVAGLTAIALVGPAKRDETGVSFRNLRGLVFVMDASRSVTEGTDFRASVTAMRQVLSTAGGRPAALVIYAGDAYLVSAFTTDHDILSTMMTVLDSGIVPDTGSRHERGLEVAGRLLSEANIVAGDVVLVTDGDQMNDTAVRYAGAIRDAGGRVSTLFVRESAGPGTSEPQMVTSVSIAGGGATADVRDPGNVVDLIASQDSRHLEKTGLRSLIWNDYGRYLLIFALIPALALFRRRA